MLWWILAMIIVVLCGGLAVATQFLFNLALKRAGSREVVFEADHNQIDAPADLNEAKLAQFKQDWLDSVTIEPDSMVNRQHLTLKGWYYTHPERATHQWAILCHGFGGRHEEMYDKAPFFDQLGFNIFMADAQGHGQSEGDYIQMGYLDRLDIVDWIQVLLRRDPEAQIVLYGISMGGATVMMTAGEPLPANVKAIIEDCGYTSVADEFRYQLKQLYHVPSWPLITTFGWLVRWRLHWRLKAASSLEALKQSRVPMLFFHGDADTFVPASMLDQNYAVAPTPKAKMLVAGAQHGMAALTAGDTYWHFVWQFLKQETQLTLIDWKNWNGGDLNEGE